VLFSWGGFASSSRWSCFGLEHNSHRVVVVVVAVVVYFAVFL